MARPAWVEALDRRAPDVVAVGGSPTSRAAPSTARSSPLRPGTAAGILAQQEAVADALADALAATTDEQLREPGGEEDWNVAQAFAHTTASRRWLAHAGPWRHVASGRSTTRRWFAPASPDPPTPAVSCFRSTWTSRAARWRPRPRRSRATSPIRARWTIR